MVTWKLLMTEAELETWDDALLRLEDHSPFQTYAWGEYQRALGWEPCRWVAINERGEISAMLLALLRRYPFSVGLIWSEGGPVGDLSACDESLHEAIKRATGLKRVYCRFRCDRQRHVEDALILSAQGWCRTWFSLTTSYSLSLRLEEEGQLLAHCERNWRRNLRRAREGNLTVEQWVDPNVDEIVAAYDSMQAAKGLEEQHSRKEFECIVRHLKDQLVIYRCSNPQGQLLSLHGWLIFGTRATALLAATTAQGREVHASYATIWAVIQHCLRLGLDSCDLGGIDPILNPGVYRFKKGTGAVPKEYLGEWDRASRPWLRWFGNWAISERQRLRKAESSLKTSRPPRSSESVFNDPRSNAEVAQPRMA